jgi:fructose-bisphosphate aldolase class II
VAMKEICSLRYQAFGSAGQADKIKALPLSAMEQRYSNGSLKQVNTPA